ncbi:EAL domain-containing protein [Pelomonas sp. V22]|uniref:putative bifunctional diguanylate cyclase/phosphodiesterase n=1 Tax=Pelomonas sp. V22 TaxID=2822139 RepID=UPI0024A971CF|nr:EAL domain-containing protein [Pelomonas sp. V22]MDI4634022.1 EAL domain-containing protein [Pelomonas sp. V22]
MLTSPLSRLRSWVLAEPEESKARGAVAASGLRWRASRTWERPDGRPGSTAATLADIQLSALRVTLLASLVLGCGVGLHTAVMALIRGKPWAVVIVGVVLTLLAAAIRQARRPGRAGGLLLLCAVYAASLAITISTGQQPELSRLGYVLSYTAPLVAGLLINWRLALGLMAFNTLFFLLAVSGYEAPQLPQQDVRLPNSLFYVHAALFMFFNLCMPLAVFRLVDGMGRIQERLRSSRQLSEQVFQAGSAPTLVCGPADEVLRANRPFLLLCGLSDEQALQGLALSELLSAPEGGPRSWRAETGLRWWLDAGGGRREVELRSVHSIGQRLQAYGFDDVTELRRLQENLAASVLREARATWHDALTGLPNRSRCIQQLDALCLLGASRPAVALLTLRINNLRQLNARYGVNACDALLKSFVRDLLASLPAGVEVARVRGSVIALQVPVREEAGEVLAQMRQLCATLPTQAMAAKQPVMLDLVFGMVAVRDLLTRQAGAIDGAELLRCSELALDMGQDPRWRQEFHGFGVFDATTARAVERGMAIEAELPQALNEGQLHLLYQPQVRPDGSLLGFEALLRWTSPALGAVSPVEFIPVAEACGLVGRITDWVVEAACAQLARWRSEGQARALTHVAVNLSAHDLERCDLFDRLSAALQRHGVTASQLELEVTESALTRQPAQALLQLQRLHEAGFTIAIDDFGTGYSSLAKLVDLPIDVLKIDRSFLHQLPGDLRRERVVRSVVSLAHSLRLRVVAEGIETGEQMLFLQALGVHGLQGYLFGRPEAPEHWAALLSWGGLPDEAARAPLNPA